MFSPAEYLAITKGAALLPRADRGRLRLDGADRRGYLQGLLTNDIAALDPGTGCYSAMLTPQGRMIADMRVLELGEAILMDTHASLAAALRERFDQFIFSEDVAVSDVSASLAQFTAMGPRAAEVLAAALARLAVGDGDVPSADWLAALRPFENRRWSPGETSLVVAASDEFGVQAFDLYSEAGAAARLGEALEAAGASVVSPAAVEVRRIEAGRPAFLQDMDDDTIPLEAGIEDRAISQTKGCYVGQEIIIRVLHRGHGRVARRLVGLTLSGPAARGDRVRSVDREVGRVTSAAHSPTLDRSIALGYVHRDFVEPGSELTVDTAAGEASASVTPLPFVPASR